MTNFDLERTYMDAKLHIVFRKVNIIFSENFEKNLRFLLFFINMYSSLLLYHFNNLFFSRL